MHLDEERIQRLLHGELAASADASAQEHLAACAECRARLDVARAEEAGVLELLRRLDHPPPNVSVATIVASSRRRIPGWGRIAAALLLALAGAGIAYAAPGSPFPRVLQRVVEWIGGPRRGAVQSAPSADTASGRFSTPGGAPLAAGAGVAVSPGERLAIVFAAEQRGTATVSLGDSADVVVRGLDGATTFTSDVDRLSVEPQGGVRRFEIVIPRAARHVEIRVGERRVYLKEGARVVSEGTPDRAGRYVLRLSGDL